MTKMRSEPIGKRQVNQPTNLINNSINQLLNPSV